MLKLSGSLESTSEDVDSGHRALLYSDGKLIVLSAASRSWVTTKLPPALQGEVTSLALGDSGSMCYIGTSNGSVHVWNPPSKRVELVVTGLGGEVTGLFSSKDGARLVGCLDPKANRRLNQRFFLVDSQRKRVLTVRQLGTRNRVRVGETFDHERSLGVLPVAGQGILIVRWPFAEPMLVDAAPKFRAWTGSFSRTSATYYLGGDDDNDGDVARFLPNSEEPKIRKVGKYRIQSIVWLESAGLVAAISGGGIIGSGSLAIVDSDLEPLYSLDFPRGMPVALAASPDGRRFAVAQEEGKEGGQITLVSRDARGKFNIAGASRVSGTGWSMLFHANELIVATDSTIESISFPN